MLDKLSFGRLVSNATVLVIVAILIAAAFDHVANWMGYRPAALCVLMPNLVALCWTAAILLTLPGAALYLVTRGTRGAGLFLAGLAIGALPMVISGFMARLFGLGCIV